MPCVEKYLPFFKIHDGRFEPCIVMKLINFTLNNLISKSSMAYTRCVSFRDGSPVLTKRLAKVRNECARCFGYHTTALALALFYSVAKTLL